jgi:hypothetical protein
MFQTAIGVSGILAVIMIVVCGIKLMAGGSVSGKNEAKECISNAIFGVLLAIGSWLILNTINPLLLIAKPSAGVLPGTLAPASLTPGVSPNPTGKGCYFKYRDLLTGNEKFSGADTCASCQNIRNAFQADTTHYLILSACYDPTLTSTPPASTPPPAAKAGSVTCPQSGVNLCEQRFRQCTNPSCAQFKSMAQSYAGGAASEAMLMAMIVQESSCIARASDAVGYDGKSGGPTHLTPATANKYKSACGLPDDLNITIGWLADKANWDKDVCLSAEYFRALAQPSACGAEIRNIAAGYNGGQGVCQNSSACSGETNCAGRPVQKWECLYDDSAHQSCNGGNDLLAGYNNARNYAMQVSYCTANYVP